MSAWFGRDFTGPRPLFEPNASSMCASKGTSLIAHASVADSVRSQKTTRARATHDRPRPGWVRDAGCSSGDIKPRDGPHPYRKMYATAPRLYIYCTNSKKEGRASPEPILS